MTLPTDADAPLLHYADALDRQDWPGLRALLDDGFRAEFVHDGRTLDADAFVAFQADYPGDWRVTVADHVRAGDRAVVRCVVTDGRETYGVATFARVGVDGRILEVVEVWTDAARPAGS
ncbi:nuclear transport factor 2 family protein [Lapillicoccus jejuensis]|uniref:SnoaL-like protein n=1 Tax=Lapillicoccus jejuensis TaxID=402171 RepID=A0A542DYH4_9MICO|nr:nuclear transport factor 2 family protein [Lapillicoccus jejuensis]TQJ07974.1 SnoaL-like protein [Lapillicoccus jejuensis]